ncbi:MAG: RAMP superfamily CRISPR-associated protein [Desulfococcaceae bacterium]|jgi:hypothetical protein|nr:RAMP superfamily CRISPR-associated protein [Desulfococcaceae bacterium]
MNRADRPRGLHSLLRVQWKLRLETPLCIRSGHTSAFGSGTGNKNRNSKMSFLWNREKGRDNAEVSELCTGLRVEQGQLVPVYSIPSSSLRGALRSWMLLRFVEEKLWSPLCRAAENVKTENMEELRAALADTSAKGLHLLTDCFGMALDTGAGDKSPVGQKGKLGLEVFPLKNPSPMPHVQGDDWQKSGNDFGPVNAPRHISVRGPADRITHGAKDGGLHYFLEFSPGQSFDAVIKMVNPTPELIGLTAVWEREINSGMLRLGGLTSVGRGRMRLLEKSHCIFAAADREAELKEFFAERMTEDSLPSQEIFSNIWKCFRLHNAQDFIPELAACLPQTEKKEENRPCTS